MKNSGSQMTLEFEIEMALKQLQKENKREYRINSYIERLARKEALRLEREWDERMREDEQAYAKR